MIKCKICGLERKYSIAEHVVKVHKMKSSEYKEKYGELKTDECKKKTSEGAKKVWQSKEYKEKMSKIRKKLYNTPEMKKKLSEGMKKAYKNGFKNWNDGLTKETDDRLKSIGEKNSKRLKGVPNPEHSKKLKESIAYKKIHHKEQWDKECERRADTIRKMISSGKFQPWKYRKNYVTGYYNGFYYASSLELSAMKLFDKMNIEWTNKHGIRIDYLIENKNRVYIPDFLIKIDNSEYLIETKGYGWKNDESVRLKKNAAEKIYNYILVFDTKELRRQIDDIIKNNKNNKEKS